MFLEPLLSVTETLERLGDWNLISDSVGEGNNVSHQNVDANQIQALK